MRKPNYSQDRAQREKEKAAKARIKEEKKRDRKATEAQKPEGDDALPEPLDPAVKG